MSSANLRRLPTGLFLLLAACSGGGGAAGDGGTGTGTGGSTGGSSGACPVGTLGCPCSSGGGCGDGLACTDGICTAPSCGDGVVQTGEECDAGPQNSDSGACKTDCTVARCGDGLVGPGEGCDDGNDVDDDGCTNDCKLPSCGDGVVQPGEACDDGNDVEADGCTNACTLPACGDGIVQAGEACDDGNASNDDACVVGCKMATCGDGFVWSGMEVCDDGNDLDTDLCRSDCTPAECGDGIVQPPAGEACDDGNDVDDDTTCTNACTVPECGDQIVQADLGEVCDDGANGAIDDGCTDTCLVAPSAIVVSDDPGDMIGPLSLGGTYSTNDFSSWQPAIDAPPEALRGYDAIDVGDASDCGSGTQIVGSRPMVATVELVDAGGVPAIGQGTDTPLGNLGNLNGSDVDPSLRLCPDGQWLVGIEVTAATFVRSVRLSCAPFEIVEENGTYAIHHGTVTKLPSAGGMGGSVVGSIDCPDGYVVGHLFTGWESTWGCHVEIGVVCNRVRPVFP